MANRSKTYRKAGTLSDHEKKQQAFQASHGRDRFGNPLKPEVDPAQGALKNVGQSNAAPSPYRYENTTRKMDAAEMAKYKKMGLGETVKGKDGFTRGGTSEYITTTRRVLTPEAEQQRKLESLKADSLEKSMTQNDELHRLKVLGLQKGLNAQAPEDPTITVQRMKQEAEARTQVMADLQGMKGWGEMSPEAQNEAVKGRLRALGIGSGGGIAAAAAAEQERGRGGVGTVRTAKGIQYNVNNGGVERLSAEMPVDKGLLESDRSNFFNQMPAKVVTHQNVKPQSKKQKNAIQSLGGGSKIAKVLAGGDPRAAEAFQSIWDDAVMPVTSFFNPNAGKTAWDWYGRRLRNWNSSQ